jgi:DNA-binding response OmpR family regulator
VELDLDAHRLAVRGIPVQLPRKEFVILRQLMENAGRIVTRRELLDNTWGPDQTGQARHYLPTYIRRIRRRIESDPRRPTPIQTVRNVGYIFLFPQQR